MNNLICWVSLYSTQPYTTENRRKEENEVWKLIGEKDYTAALQRVKSAKALGLWNFLLQPRIIALEMETDVPTPKDKVKALELKIKELELKILTLELNLREIKNDELLLIDSRKDRDMSRIEMRLLDLEERLNKP